MLRKVIEDSKDLEKIFALTIYALLIVCASFSLELSSRDIRNGGLDKNEDGFDAMDLGCLLYSLAEMTTITALTMYGVAREVPSVSKNLYFSLSRKAAEEKEKHIDHLYDSFQSLSQDSKITLWEDNLAEKDDVGLIDLKYICPISKTLIADPVFILVAPKYLQQRLAELDANEDKDEMAQLRLDEYQTLAKYLPTELLEIYDANSILKWYREKPQSLVSVKTQQPIVSNQGLHSYQLTKEHAAYIKKLETTLKLLLAKENKRDEKRNVCALM